MTFDPQECPARRREEEGQMVFEGWEEHSGDKRAKPRFIIALWKSFLCSGNIKGKMSPSGRVILLLLIFGRPTQPPVLKTPDGNAVFLLVGPPRPSGMVSRPLEASVEQRRPGEHVGVAQVHDRKLGASKRNVAFFGLLN